MANGNFAGGDGSKENPFLIEDAHDLNAIRYKGTFLKHYKLVNDIDLNIAPYNEGKGWEPIQGAIKLDGDFFSINNLYINNPSGENMALFSKGGDNTQERYVHNLKMRNAEVHCNSGAILFSAMGGRTSPPNVICDIDVEGRLHIYGNSGNAAGVVTGIGNTVSRIKADISVVLEEGSGRSRFSGLVARYGNNKSIHNSFIRLRVLNNVVGSIIYGLANSTQVRQEESKNNLVLIELIGSVDTTIYPISSFNMDKETSSTNFTVIDDVGSHSTIKDNNNNIITQEQSRLGQTYIDANWDKETTIVNGKEIPVWILKDGELPKLWFEVPPSKYLIETDKGIINMDGDVIDTVDLDNHGFSLKKLQEYMNTNLNIIKIYSNKNILKGTGNKILEGEILAMLDEDKKTVPIAKSNIIPKPQLVLPNGDIKLRMMDQIHEFTLYSNTNNNGDIKVIFSTDSGKTWHSYRDEELIEININKLSEVKEKGLTPDEFNQIKEDWNKIIQDKEIRFAYYLEIEDFNSIAEVDQLDVKMDMYGRWRKVKEDDYTYSYDNEHIYVEFFKDGSYKVNYQE